MPQAQYISTKTWERDLPSETTKATEKPDVVRTREQRNGRSLISSKLDNAACVDLCVNSILGFPEANLPVARTGLAQDAGI